VLRVEARSVGVRTLEAAVYYIKDGEGICNSFRPLSYIKDGEGIRVEQIIFFLLFKINEALLPLFATQVSIKGSHL
jgi:hypothetical protein